MLLLVPFRRLDRRLAKVFRPLAEVLVMTHHHVGAGMSEEFGDLGDADTVRVIGGNYPSP